MAKVRPLTPDQARRTFIGRFGKVADGLRQIATNMGARPYRVFLTYTRWSGTESGEGVETVVHTEELLPTPKVVSLDSVSFSVFHAGTLPQGSVRLEEVSTGYTADQLTGRMVPVAHQDHLPEPYEFFYEIVEDGRGDDPAVRAKFRVLSTPFLDAENVQWKVMLERISQDRTRDGKSAVGTGKE